MDKRIIRTKEKIQNGLTELLDKFDIQQITVSLLCSQAGVNRSTFYVHYNNVAECFEEITDGILAEMRKAMYREPVRNPEAYLRIYCRTARKYPAVFAAIHSTGIHTPMIHKMVEIYNEALCGQFFIPYSSENLEYSFLFSGFYGMVAAWLENGCRESDEELLRVIRTISEKKI